MKRESTWLQAAVRAHEAQTLDSQRRVRDAWDALLDAAERERQAEGCLDELAAAWTAQRTTSRWVPELDNIYGRFHAHVHHQSELAARQLIDCRHRWEAGQADLRSRHSTQRLLERLAQHIEAENRRALSVSDARNSAEAWLLAKHGAAAAEPLGPDGGTAADCQTTQSPGGASDSRAS